MEAEALFNTMHNSLAEMKADLSILRDVEADPWAETLSDRLAEVKGVKVGETLTHVRGASPV